MRDTLALPKADERTWRTGSSYAFVLICGVALLLAYNYRHLLIGLQPRRNHPEVLAALCLVLIALRPVTSEARFRQALLGLSLIGCVVQLGRDCLGVLAFSALVIGLSRMPGPVLVRAAVALVAWLSALVPKLAFSYEQFAAHIAFYMFWAGAAFSAFYVIVERSRGALEQYSWRDDLSYLIALPRLLMPFFQPIAPSRFWASRTSRLDARLAARGLLLGLYGILLFFLMRKLPYIQPAQAGVPPTDHGIPPLLLPAHNLVFIYASNASAIFCAVGLFRLLGFDLGSGFHFPLAARSFAEFFRRWNYYIYEEVRSLFLFPILARTRAWFPEKLALVISSYLAIFLGTFGLNALVVPMALNADPLASLALTMKADFILFHALYWTGIILPQLLPRPAWLARPTLPLRILQHALFIVLITLLTRAAYNAGVAIL